MYSTRYTLLDLHKVWFCEVVEILAVVTMVVKTKRRYTVSTDIFVIVESHCCTVSVERRIYLLSFTHLFIVRENFLSNRGNKVANGLFSYFYYYTFWSSVRLSFTKLRSGLCILIT